MPRRSSQPPTDSPSGARVRAVRALARREHSAAELRRRLIARGVPAPLADQAVRECTEHGWQSDARYAEAMLRQRTMQSYGPLRIAAELAAADVATPLIRRALAVTETDWVQRAAELRARRFGAPPRCAADWQRQYRFLVQRGFSAEQASAALRSAPKDSAPKDIEP
ncbi:MAG: regulatory protein RecX [Gammaproteobacteria bacterium]|nr:regulatory protein RecX [Gammaproteobacteria bacterium]